ncbi:MAG: hypothetical protein NVSMB6_23560 [Burkholderiaceae bacterium]
MALGGMPKKRYEQKFLKSIMEAIMSDTDHLTLMNGLRWAVPSLVIALLVLLYTVQLRSSLTSDTITAKSLSVESVMLRNAAGAIVAMMSSAPDGTPQISLFDAQKKVRLSIGLRSNGGPSISLIDSEQSARAMLALNDQQDPLLTMSNAAKLTRAALAIDTGGSGHVVLYGVGGGLNLSAADGRVRWTPVGGGTAQDISTQK